MRKVEFNGNIYTEYRTHKKIAVVLLETYCKSLGYRVEDIIKGSHEAKEVEKRAIIARALMRRGLGVVAIAHAMKKHHTTILNYKLPKFDYLDTDWK